VVKRIEAIIKPFKLDEVRQALSEVGVVGLTVSEVLGGDRDEHRADRYRGVEYAVDLTPRMKLEVAVADAQADQIISVIAKASKIGHQGCGMIFVSQLEDAVRIRTGEHGERVL
jgi:nitrogen regulatory protein PII